MNSIILLAALLTLNPGYNNPGVAGEVVAIEAATTNATATIAIKSVQSITAYTNATAQVVNFEPAWRVTVIDTDGPETLSFPDDCFPITYSDMDAGVQVTISNNTEIVYARGEQYTYTSWIGGGYSSGFAFFSSSTLEYLGNDVPISGLLFNGIAPVEGEFPLLLASPATYVTNVVGYLDYSAFVDTNGVSTIVGEPVRFDMAITNTVIVQTVPAATYAKTNDLATVTTSAHFGNVTTNAFLFGDGILVTGAAEGDSIKVLLK